MPGIVVVGSANTDFVVPLRRIPGPGETELGGDLVRASGGKGANQAVAAARLGGEVTFVGCLGDDDLGDAYLKCLARDAMDLRFVRRVKNAPSGVALIFVGPDGENAIAVAPGANQRLSLDDIDRAAAVFAAADVVLVQLEVPLDTVLHAVRLGREHGATVILNPAPCPRIEEVGELLRMASVLTPNEHEARALSGGIDDPDRAARELQKLGPESVVITLGKRGALCVGAGRSIALTVRRTSAVDATGAGDCFNGALAVALAEKQPLERAVQFACIAASLSVERMGAQPSYPLRAEVDAAMSDPATGHGASAV